MHLERVRVIDRIKKEEKKAHIQVLNYNTNREATFSVLTVRVSYLFCTFSHESEPSDVLCKTVEAD